MQEGGELAGAADEPYHCCTNEHGMVAFEGRGWTSASATTCESTPWERARPRGARLRAGARRAGPCVALAAPGATRSNV